ncbi:MAG TPA: phospholipase D-like domain-containing protein [Thermoanaerobaculia bacterium]
MTIPIWVLALVALTIVILILIIWSLKRRSHPRLTFENDLGIQELASSIAGVTQSTFVEGNRIELVQNGEFFEWVMRDLRTAQHSINLESFLAKDGEVTRGLAEVLAAKAREGVHVRVMLDASGGRKFGKASLKQMKEAGVKVKEYHPLHIVNLGKLNNRDHRKIVVVDGRLAYVGGHCLVDTWLGDAEDKKHFRDISARVQGPVVRQLQSAFTENWMEESGEVLGGDEYFPTMEPAGATRAHVVYVSPAGSPSAVELLHYMAIHAAQKRITVQNPYFLPDKSARDVLIDAVKRGVEVRIMIPHESASDAPIVQHASHHHYGTLLKGGVRLFDYRRTLLHQKVITIDGCWSAIGSTNFDNRSFEVNDEVSMVVYDEAIAQELERTFDEDLQYATEVKLDEWRKRPVSHKLRDFFMFLVGEQL